MKEFEGVVTTDQRKGGGEEDTEKRGQGLARLRPGKGFE